MAVYILWWRKESVVREGERERVRQQEWVSEDEWLWGRWAREVEGERMVCKKRMREWGNSMERWRGRPEGGSDWMTLKKMSIWYLNFLVFHLVNHMRSDEDRRGAGGAPHVGGSQSLLFASSLPIPLSSSPPATHGAGCLSSHLKLLQTLKMSLFLAPGGVDH